MPLFIAFPLHGCTGSEVLSRGEQQRLAILRLFWRQAEVLQSESMKVNGARARRRPKFAVLDELLDHSVGTLLNKRTRG